MCGKNQVMNAGTAFFVAVKDLSLRLWEGNTKNKLWSLSKYKHACMFVSGSIYDFYNYLNAEYK